MDRRDFLKTTGGVAIVGVTAVRDLAGASQAVSIIVDPKDPIASAPSAAWAVGELQSALSGQGVLAKTYSNLPAAPAGDRCIVVAGSGGSTAQQFLKAAKLTMPASPEALCLIPGNLNGRSALLAGGSDARGVVYAVLELADRAKYAEPGSAPLDVRSAVVEKPANLIRSSARYFESDVEDKSWFNDRSWWGDYLTALASNRFNRFNLSTGLGYNGNRDIPDAYFYFAYPFLLAVPGYDVRAVPLSNAERDSNLATLRFISDETVARGLQFNLGLWSHAYQWPNPEANYKITGLTAATHAAYCRDALAALLKACPNITGLTIRMHSESGIPAGSYAFWETVFQGIKRAGRRIDLDLHAKGTDQRHIDIGLSTGNPVSMAPKFWAEHNGMPYHQASIRELERVTRQGRGGRSDNPSTEAERSFLRYGYGDYLRDDRNFGILHRIWPGTQRHLLWGDPMFAAGYGRVFSFSGSVGFEVMEPLSFKGRMGSGKTDGRNAYADKSLEPKHDWQKFEYQYRLYGRLTYNPETDADGWRRFLRREFQSAAPAVEASLANASRILPIILTTHGASGSNNSYWPEMYMNMPIVDAGRAQPYGDTPDPKVFGTVSSFDPQLFSSIEECAEGLASGKTLAKYTTLDVAQWLEDLSTTAAENQAQVTARVTNKNAPEVRRLVADVAIQAGIGKFFAYKFRSAVLWALSKRTGDRTAATEAVKAYRTARDAWATMAEHAKTVYVSDITYGLNANMRGHWSDRLAGIDADLADMEKHSKEPMPATTTAVDPAVVRMAIRTVLTRPQRPSFAAQHTPAQSFEPGKPLEIAWSLAHTESRNVSLQYRQADQSQTWRTTPMAWHEGAYRGAIPGDYTQSRYPLLYYFEVHEAGGSGIYPGVGKDLSGQPYYLVRGSRAKATNN
jgi:hypothetical protein